MKESILITGSTGFIGQNLTKLLLSLNYKVLVLIRKESKNKLFVQKTQKRWIQASLLFK